MKAYLEFLRPHQWLKSLMLLFPPFLGGGILQFDSIVSFILPLISFSAAASSIYIVNDLLDLEQDVHHPKKCLRPLAAGKINKTAALCLSLLLGGGGGGLRFVCDDPVSDLRADLHGDFDPLFAVSETGSGG